MIKYQLVVFFYISEVYEPVFKDSRMMAYAFLKEELSNFTMTTKENSLSKGKSTIKVN